MDSDTVIGIIAAIVFVVFVAFVLKAINRSVVKFFDIVSSIAVVASIFVVIFPPYKLFIPGAIEIFMGRHPIWDVPKSQSIGSYLPIEIKSIIPTSISGMKISLVIDHATLLTNLLSIFIIYLMVLSVFLVHREKT
tara:strand:+ start:77 stop:484 length:408 start_codon:yes stop_codon:yes gene_type:complete